MSTDHGAQHDNFPFHHGAEHGGAQFDQAFTPASAGTKHGDRFDSFPARRGLDRYGDRFDEFPMDWHEMPVLHGRHFDEGFSTPVALTNKSGHGTWFDVFMGAASVRYMADGADYEGTVIDCNRSYATVLSREGKLHEVLLSQIRSYAEGYPTDAGMPGRKGTKTAQPGKTDDLGIPASKAEAPSAHSATASGGHLRQVTAKTYAGDIEIDVAKFTSGKTKLGPQTVERHRANLSKLNNPSYVPKKHGPLSCPGCGKPGKYNVGHTPGKGAKMGTALMHGHCTGCGFKHSFKPPRVMGKTTVEQVEWVQKTQEEPDEWIVAKSVDTTETAAQRKDEEAPAEGQAYCPQCRHTCRRPEDGKCPTCGTKVTVKKTLLDGEVDVAKVLDELRAEVPA